MKILVSGASKTVRRLAGHPHLGQLITPQDGNKIIGIPFAADNAAFSNWDEAKFIAMLDRCKNTSPMWVAAPDVVENKDGVIMGDARKTARLFDQWHPEITGRGLPIALVLQNGQESIGLPAEWKYDAVFIGGDDAFKMGGMFATWSKRSKVRASSYTWAELIRSSAYSMPLNSDAIL